ncbi:protein Mpv17 isoform X2 [Narcine bancroftii]|uniref:protein Mpv17 isoform X2 n=1 Tax=Narcine bancroftii TaxID=1343680 RepID=UPI00383120CA
MLQSFKLAWRAYQVLMTKHPWKVQILTSGGLVGFSDIVSQQLVERQGLANHNVKRTIKMTTVGLIYVGPILGVWYRTLDRLVVGQTKTAAFKKMLFDQFALAPCFLAGFIVVTGFLGGLSQEKIWLKLQKDYKTTLLSNYAIWPTAQLLNFYFIPLEHRKTIFKEAAEWCSTFLWASNSHRFTDVSRTPCAWYKAGGEFYGLKAQEDTLSQQAVSINSRHFAVTAPRLQISSQYDGNTLDFHCSLFPTGHSHLSCVSSCRSKYFQHSRFQCQYRY